MWRTALVATRSENANLRSEAAGGGQLLAAIKSRASFSHHLVLLGKQLAKEAVLIWCRWVVNDAAERPPPFLIPLIQGPRIWNATATGRGPRCQNRNEKGTWLQELGFFVHAGPVLSGPLAQPHATRPYLSKPFSPPSSDGSRIRLANCASSG